MAMRRRLSRTLIRTKETTAAFWQHERSTFPSWQAAVVPPLKSPAASACVDFSTVVANLPVPKKSISTHKISSFHSINSHSCSGGLQDCTRSASAGKTCAEASGKAQDVPASNTLPCSRWCCGATQHPPPLPPPPLPPPPPPLSTPSFSSSSSSPRPPPLPPPPPPPL
eukprot:676052-Pyramimonas_sp.AAC.1